MRAPVIQCCVLTLNATRIVQPLARRISRSWDEVLDSGISRRARRPCRYEAYLPDRLAELSVLLPADVAADISDAELGVQRLNSDATELTSLEALARLLLRVES